MKFNIAICGTFNIDNYGDVLFPEIFKRAMQQRGLDFELFLISPANTCENTLCPNAKVYSIDMLDYLHKSYGLDAIVIGGGALVHYNKIPVKLPNDSFFSDYNIYDSWYTPIEFAARNNIKVLFNLPQIPYEIPLCLKEVTKAAFAVADYICFRDKVSAQYLRAIYDENSPEINVYPDSVCCIAQLFSPKELASLRKSVLPFEDKYAVVQFNAQKSPKEDEKLFEVIKSLEKRQYKIVFLPLGYTHNDDNVLSDYNRKYGNIGYMPENKLNIFEMTAILSGCSVYIGSSFHGAIVSMSFGALAVSYNYIFPKTKNREVFSMYKVENFIAESADDISKILDDYFCGKLSFNPDTNGVAKCTQEHFDRLFDYIKSSRSCQNTSAKLHSSLFELLPLSVILSEKNALLTNEKQLTDNHVKNLEAVIDSMKAQSAEDKNMVLSLNTKLDDIQSSCDSLKAETERLSIELDKANEKYSAALNSCNAKQREYDALSAQHSLLQNNYNTLLNGYNEIQASFFWKITSPCRKFVQCIKGMVAKSRSLMTAMVYVKGFLRGGPKGAKARVRLYREQHKPVLSARCIFDLDDNIKKQQSEYRFEKNIKFSILVPLYNTPQNFLSEMICSVECQTYSNWELCLADGSDEKHKYVESYCKKIAKSDLRVKYLKLAENKGISENTNACLEMATGDYIALFDHDDLLEPTALFEYMKVICGNNADFIYCDEDKFENLDASLSAAFYDANYKPDFAADNLRANNYICHFTVFEKSLIEKAGGGFRKEFDGSQDHDLILRLTEQAENITHIPKVLYHWRVSAASVASDPYAKPYTIEAGRKAVAEHLERVGLKGSVDSTKIHPNIYKIKYDIIGNPLVSIIIPNYNHIEELSRCIDSILEKTTYKNYEIIIVENNSDSETFEYYDTLKKYDNIKVVVYKTNVFNYSDINNYGVQFANGTHYILLNNDVEIITPEWIEEMLMYSQRSDVGAVGAMLYYPNDTIQHAGVTIGVLTLAGHNFKHSARGNPGYFGRAGYQQNVSAVTAACVMIPAKVYKEVDGLDSSFAVAFNDIDLCMRIRKAGYNIIFTPFAELYHYESASRGDDMSPEKRARFVSEVQRFQHRWKKELEQGDPYYNPNLTLDREDFSPK